MNSFAALCAGAESGHVMYMLGHEDHQIHGSCQLFSSQADSLAALEEFVGHRALLEGSIFAQTLTVF
ncbi:hypothetical protein IE81DRAFT_35678 [Ceraceosorus guamensis]|uniref:Uncharacterized protein n=1 Tax=Ceraceosorus guamensis TaxID=1522189 RepID=A0A316W7V2_9BASI|nr:hypothetical protein IE81DRAFT_35678 [Ceraceosorus guamensis]PWN44133.1 hypothetical protein IE81DRAFT_35678 [Ceraceosorus guamensis]